MPESADHTPETEAKQSRGLGSYVVWGFVVVMVYVLSYGPVMMLANKNIISPKIPAIYWPLWDAYEKSPPVHRLLGMYLHLWCPDLFDKNGD